MTRNSLTRGPEMSNGTPKRQRDQPESDADRSRDLDKLNQQVVCSDLFDGGGREEDFQPASPEVERSPSGAYSARSERIGKHFATDRYLSRGGTVDAAVPPRLACTTSGVALTTVGC